MEIVAIGRRKAVRIKMTIRRSGEVSFIFA